jgi:hypothetical protein
MPGMSFRTAPAGHPFDRPQTLLGSTQWYPAPPGSCPECDLRGWYDGDKVRLYLGKGSAGQKHGEQGWWGPYGNGFWGGQNNGGWGAAYSGGGWHGQGYRGGGNIPGNIAVRGQVGYGLDGKYQGNPHNRRAGGWSLGCFGL